MLLGVNQSYLLWNAEICPSKPLCRVSPKFQGRRSATELFTVSRSSSALLPRSCTALLSPPATSLPCHAPCPRCAIRLVRRRPHCAAQQVRRTQRTLWH